MHGLDTRQSRLLRTPAGALTSAPPPACCAAPQSLPAGKEANKYLLWWYLEDQLKVRGRRAPALRGWWGGVSSCWGGVAPCALAALRPRLRVAWRATCRAPTCVRGIPPHSHAPPPTHPRAPLYHACARAPRNWWCITWSTISSNIDLPWNCVTFPGPLRAADHRAGGVQPRQPGLLEGQGHKGGGLRGARLG